MSEKSIEFAEALSEINVSRSVFDNLITFQATNLQTCLEQIVLELGNHSRLLRRQKGEDCNHDSEQMGFPVY
jgi:hypothetical protein